MASTDISPPETFWVLLRYSFWSAGFIKGKKRKCVHLTHHSSHLCGKHTPYCRSDPINPRSSEHTRVRPVIATRGDNLYPVASQFSKIMSQILRHVCPLLSLLIFNAHLSLLVAGSVSLFTGSYTQQTTPMHDSQSKCTAVLSMHRAGQSSPSPPRLWCGS